MHVCDNKYRQGQKVHAFFTLLLELDAPRPNCIIPRQWCAKYYFKNSILFWKYKIVFYFVFLKYSYQCILFCIFKILFLNTFCKCQTKGKLISDRDPQLLMSLSCRSAVQKYFILKSILKILFYFIFSKYFLGVFCTSLHLGYSLYTVLVFLTST